MSDNKPKITKMNTPVGVAIWPKLTEADYGTKDYPKPEGEYSVKMRFKETDPAFVSFREKMEAFIPAVEEMATEEFNGLKKPQRDKLKAPTFNDVFVTVYDEDEEPTGEVEMKFSMKAGGVVKKGPRAGKKWSRRPDIFDAFGRKVPPSAGVEIWGGSELIIAFNFREDGYFIPATGAWGIKLQLDAAQIITLRQGGERSAEDHGFKAQEGGFNADAYTPPARESDEADDGEDEYSTPETSGEADPAGAEDF